MQPPRGECSTSRVPADLGVLNLILLTETDPILLFILFFFNFLLFFVWLFFLFLNERKQQKRKHLCHLCRYLSPSRRRGTGFVLFFGCLDTCIHYYYLYFFWFFAGFTEKKPHGSPAHRPGILVLFFFPIGILVFTLVRSYICLILHIYSSVYSIGFIRLFTLFVSLVYEFYPWLVCSLNVSVVLNTQ